MDDWEVIGNAELEVMAALASWPELLCRVWQLERENSWWFAWEISNRKVAGWFDMFPRA